MAYGDVLISVAVPEQPSGSQWTHVQFIQAVKDGVDQQFDTLGINDERPEWSQRYDIPASESAAPGFVEDRLDPTSVDVSDFDFTLANQADPEPKTEYCLANSFFECYAAVAVTPKLPTTPNPFILTVQLDGSYTVKVSIRFVVRSLAPFPVANPT